MFFRDELFLFARFKDEKIINWFNSIKTSDLFRLIHHSLLINLNIFRSVPCMISAKYIPLVR